MRVESFLPIRVYLRLFAVANFRRGKLTAEYTEYAEDETGLRKGELPNRRGLWSLGCLSPSAYSACSAVENSTQGMAAARHAEALSEGGTLGGSDIQVGLPDAMLRWSAARHAITAGRG